MTPEGDRAEACDRQAIVLMFHAQSQIVRNRLEGLRLLNPEVDVYGIYGGPRDALGSFSGLRPHFDDFWVAPDSGKAWQWFNNDLVLVSWFQDRGASLPWDQIVVQDWDFVTTQRAAELSLHSARTLLLPGARPLADLRSDWVWVQPWSEHYHHFTAFLAHPSIDSSNLWASQFMFASLSRAFMSEYSSAAPGVPGFVEYRLPSLAAGLGFSFLPSALEPYWGDRGDILLNGTQDAVPLRHAIARLTNPSGPRACHPLYELVPWGEVLKELAQR
jgi:hypothetical protein